MCIGQKVYDSTSGTPDVRWFIVEDGVVASAVVHGNPPQTLKVSTGPHGHPAPRTLALSITNVGATSEEVQLTAVGPNVDLVGFAVASGSHASTRTWRQIALADVRVPAAGATTTIAKPAPARPVLVLAAACLGGDGPTDIVQARRMDPASPARVTTLEISEGELTAAARSACQYPRRG
ncbi:hypothetical protein [Plantactinospora sp. CA-290183]|uniref:hypothetical protein n=1 Tax=Plantactinospora sp. CA-290183 TaxID=3240006 RepID=UPI003D910790